MLLWNLELFYVNSQNDIEKQAAYECGFEPFDLARSLIDVQFYIVAILFLVFDIEVIFLLPWAVTLPQLATIGFWSMIIFIIILLGGLLYEIQSGALLSAFGVILSTCIFLSENSKEFKKIREAVNNAFRYIGETFLHIFLNDSPLTKEIPEDIIKYIDTIFNPCNALLFMAVLVLFSAYILIFFYLLIGIPKYYIFFKEVEFFETFILIPFYVNFIHVYVQHRFSCFDWSSLLGLGYKKMELGPASSYTVVHWFVVFPYFYSSLVTWWSLVSKLLPILCWQPRIYRFVPNPKYIWMDWGGVVFWYCYFYLYAAFKEIDDILYMVDPNTYHFIHGLFISVLLIYNTCFYYVLFKHKYFAHFEYLLGSKKNKQQGGFFICLIYCCNNCIGILLPSESILILLWLFLFVSLICIYFGLTRRWIIESKSIIALLIYISTVFFLINIIYNYILYDYLGNNIEQTYIFYKWILVHLMQNDIYKIAQFFFLCLSLFGMQLTLLHIINNKSHYAFEFILIFITLLLSLHPVVLSFNVLIVIVSIEIVSLSLSILIGQNRLGIEAALKYFSFSAFTTVFFLSGLFFSYFGFLNLGYDWLDIKLFNESFIQNHKFCSILISVFLFGFLFKLAAFPCSMWAPDVYEGAINPIMFMLATVTKVGFFSGFIQLIIIKLWILIDFSQTLLLLSITGSLLTGSFGGLRQDNIKRFLAFTSMHHVGFLLASIYCDITITGIQDSFFYLIVYVAALAGFLAVYLLINTKRGNNINFFTDLNFIIINTQITFCFGNLIGLMSLIIYLLSMAGIPPFTGFFGKYIIFILLSKKKYITILLFSLITSFISIFNYLHVVKIALANETSYNINLLVAKSKRFLFNFVWYIWTECKGIFLFLHSVFIAFQTIGVFLLKSLISVVKGIHNLFWY
jgi:NADH-quinone oxidoreductase subunit N